MIRRVPRKWRIPTGLPGLRGGTAIGPRGYLILWTDGDTTDTGLHASFRLSAGGDDVYLYAADGVTLIDSLAFGPQTADVSYGRYPDGSQTLRFFRVPTPGQANNEGYLGEVTPLRFSHERGFYSSPFDVTIQTATEDVRILYTLDGHAPNEIPMTAPVRARSDTRATRSGGPVEPPAPVATGTGATLYSGPIRISRTTCLRVMAEKARLQADAGLYAHLHLRLPPGVAVAAGPLARGRRRQGLL